LVIDFFEKFTCTEGHSSMGTERTRELRRRRHRKKKVIKLLSRVKKGDNSIVVEKLRKLTPGASTIIANHSISK
jgi:hypothetical protein